MVELVDLPAFGRPARLVWRKHRWACSDETCPTKTWTEQEPRIAAPRLALTDRAGRWVTFQVGKHGRTVNEVAQDLGCDWHTVNDAVIAYGTELVDDENRIGDVEALGLDETLFWRLGRWRRQAWSTQIVDVAQGRLLDVVEGRTGVGPASWPRSSGRTMVFEDQVGDAGPVGSVSQRVRHHAARRHPGRRPVPRRQIGEHQDR